MKTTTVYSLLITTSVLLVSLSCLMIYLFILSWMNEFYLTISTNAFGEFWYEIVALVLVSSIGIIGVTSVFRIPVGEKSWDSTYQQWQRK